MSNNGISLIINEILKIPFYRVPLYCLPLACSMYVLPRETFMIGTSFWLYTSLNDETKRRELADNENLIYEESSNSEDDSGVNDDSEVNDDTKEKDDSEDDDDTKEKDDSEDDNDTKEKDGSEDDNYSEENDNSESKSDNTDESTSSKDDSTSSTIDESDDNKILNTTMVAKDTDLDLEIEETIKESIEKVPSIAESKENVDTSSESLPEESTWWFFGKSKTE